MGNQVPALFKSDGARRSGNHVQVVDYAECRFRKAPDVQEAPGLDDVGKSPEAVRELEEAGLAPVDTS
jgi:hypothetical protein